MASKVSRKILSRIIIFGISVLFSFAFVFLVIKVSKEKAIEEYLVNLFRLQSVSQSTQMVETCLQCHIIENEIEKFHDPSVIGCSSCHLGNPKASQKLLAHSGLVLFPGNLDVVDKTCGRSGCHQEIAERIQQSLMNTMSGVVSVDKFVFGEIKEPNGLFIIEEIDKSPADVHLRNLCASCHLGKNKAEFAAIGELTRGGGCSACHLKYEHNSLAELNQYKTSRNFAPKFHPRISLNVEPIACFGCHSRSGRISTNFEGLMETTLEEIPREDSSKFVRLADGRVFVKVAPDVHFTKGLTCIDCHTSREIMGDGVQHAHKEEQVEISCKDCHPEGNPQTISFDSLNSETKLLIGLRGWQSFGNKRFVAISKTGNGFSNVTFENGDVIVFSKLKNKQWIAKRQSTICLNERKLHPNLDCSVCHTQWVPRCVSCHTHYEPQSIGWDNLADTSVVGCWVESGGNFFATLPTLGIVTENSAAKIKTFMPGMVLSIDGKNFSKHPISIRARYFAPTFSHTIAKSVPACKECHLNPLAYGYGNGVFKVFQNGNTKKIGFQATFPVDSVDGLPKDAWIGFQHTKIGKSTRTNAHSLTRQQTDKMLLVGSCFFCHDWDAMKSLEVFSGNYRKRMTKKCILPRR